MYSKKLQVLLLIYEIHTLRRLYENLRFRKSGSKMLAGHYLLGYLFYTHTFLALLLCGRRSYENTMSSMQFVGLGIYAIGSIWQNASHEHLIAQKNHSQYLVLKKGCFKWITGPHYLGEIIVYTGIALIAQHWLIWLVLGWVLCNMVAISSSYACTVKNKEQSLDFRWTLIPFLY